MPMVVLSSSKFLRLENESIHLMPFVGGSLVTEKDLFLQGFVQVDVDANGSPVSSNSNPFGVGGFTNAGRLNSATMLYVDLSAGFWLFREAPDSTRNLTAVMPVAELHLNRSLTRTDSVPLGTLGTVGSPQNFELLNTTIGMVFEVRHTTQVSFGYSTSLQRGNDSQFGNEFRVQVSHRFGRN